MSRVLVLYELHLQQIIAADTMPSSQSSCSRISGSPAIEEHQRCFGLGSYFMAAVLAADSYSRGGFIFYLADSARRVVVPGGSTFHLEPGTIHSCWNLLVPDVLDARWISRKLHSFRFMIDGGG